MGYIYLDTETTGFKPGQIAQFSYIVEEDGKVTESDNIYFIVDTMEPDAEAVHGLSVARLMGLSGGKRFKDYADRIESLVNSHTVVAHNVAFDSRFLSSELWRCNKVLKPVGELDTMKQFTDVIKLPKTTSRGKGLYKYPSLAEVGNYFNIRNAKVIQLADRLFKSDSSIGLHDSRFDTTMMFIAQQLYREDLALGVNSSSGAWHTWINN